MRYLWPLPWTLFGLLVAAGARLLGARLDWHTGVLEVHGGALATACRRLPGGMGFCAITLGHVVLALDADTMACSRAHERVHVRQYERWGPLFVPAYLASSAAAWWRGGCPYRDNRFEQQAYACAPVHAIPHVSTGMAKVE